MRDPAQTTFIFVLQPEATSIKETRRAIGELEKLGIYTTSLIVNGIIPVAKRANPSSPSAPPCSTATWSRSSHELRLPAQRMSLLERRDQRRGAALRVVAAAL